MEEDEIDLRKYVELLLRHWKLIVGLPLLAALTAFVILTFIPPSYEATALITVVTPRTLTSNAANLTGIIKAYMSLATSDGVLNNVLADPALTACKLKSNSLEELRKVATASASTADPSAIVLKVKCSDSTSAAALTNAWAGAFTAELYRQEQGDLTALQAQVLEADGRLKLADADLVAYQASNPANTVAVRLSAQEAILADHLSRRYLYALLIKDAQDQQARLAKLEPNAPANGIDTIAILELLQRFSSASAASSLSKIEPAQSVSSQFSGAQVNIPASPFQLQITDNFLAGKTVGEQTVYLDTLVSSLQVRVTEIDSLATALEPEILSLQGKLSAATAGEAKLVQKRDLARVDYQAVVQKMDDARLVAVDETNNVHVANRANIPTGPVSGRLITMVLAGAIVLMLTVAGVLGQDWWKEGIAEPKRKES